MATQTIQFRSPPSQTVTLRLFVAGSDTQIASAAATEATNRKGTYTAAFTDVPAAEYQYIATIGTSPIIPVASGYVLLTLTTATFQTYDAAKAVNLSEVPSPDAGAIAEAVAQYDQRDEEGTPGTIGWYFKKLRQASNTVEVVVTNDITPTATTFSVALTTYPTGAFKHSVLAVVEDGAILDQNSPILTFTNNTTYSTIVLEEAFTQAPAVGNVLLINVVSHVHSVASIAAGVWETLTSTLNTVGSTGRALARLIGLVEDSSGDRFTAKAVELINEQRVNVLPAVGISADRSPGVVLSPFVGETISQSITLYETDGTTPIVLTGKSLEIVFETRAGTDVAVIPNVSISVSGTNDNIVTFSYTAAITLSERVLRFALRDDAAPATVYLTGLCKVGIAPGSDPA